MAFTNPHSNSQSIAAAATSSVLTVNAPALGQLCIGGCGLVTSSGTPVISITDNGSGGWTLIRSAVNIGGSLIFLYWWYKKANATDVSSLSTVTFSWTNGSTVVGGSCWMDEYDGFSGTPTLDLNPTGVESGGATTITITGGVAAQATELALSFVLATGATGAVVPGSGHTYSPDNGTTTYAWTSTLAAGTYDSIRSWAAPTATPSTASKFKMSWTTGHVPEALGATFYDLPSSLTVNPLPGVATAAGVAPTSGITVGPPAGVASAVGTATTSAVLNAAPAAGTGTAVGITPTVTTVAAGAVVGGSATAIGVTPSVTVSISAAPGSGTAVGITPTVTFSPAVVPDAYDEPGAYDEHLSYDYDLFFPSVRPTKGWTFVLVQTDGTPIGELTQAKAKQVTWPLGDIPSASFTIDGRLSQAALILELATDLIVYDKAGVKRFRGRMGSSSDDISAAGHTSTFSAVSYEGIFATRRSLRDSTVGGTATTTFTDVDQGLIAAQLINDSENQPGNTPLVTPGTGLNTGVLRTIAFTVLSKIGDLINGQLANVDNGFDWEIDGDLKFNIYYPERGIVTPLVLEYDANGGGNVLTVQRTVDTTNFGNVIVETGASSTTPVVVQVGAPSLREAGLFETVIGDTSVIDQTTLTLKANLALEKSDTLVPTHVLTLRTKPTTQYPDGWWTPEKLWLGDTALVVVKSGRVADIAMERISQVQVAIGDDGGEVVTLTTGPVSQDQAQQLDAALNRITRLETT